MSRVQTCQVSVGANTSRAHRATPIDVNARSTPSTASLTSPTGAMSPPPGVHPGGHPASDAMYGTTTAADATIDERYFSLYAKGKTPPGSSTPAAEARDAGDDAPQRKWNHLPVDSIRAEFPALTDANHDGWAFMENAGGSQVPRRVADAMHHYMCNNYVQLGAGYPHSDRADATRAQGAPAREDVRRGAAVLRGGAGFKSSSLAARRRSCSRRSRRASTCSTR